MHAQRGSCPSQMRLEHLPDVHSRWNSQRVQDYLYGAAVGKERHVLHRQDPGYDAFVPVAAGHLVALGDFSLLSHIHAHQLVNARPQLIAIFAREHVNRDYLARLAMRHLQRSIAYIPRLLAKDRPKQSLLRRKLALALGRDLSHQDVAGANLGAHADDPLVVQILQGVFAHVGDVAGYLLRTQFGVASLRLVLLNMNGREHIVAYQALRYENRVLVVAAFPGHERDQHIPPQSHFALVGRRAVGQHIADFHTLPNSYDGALVHAGTLIGAGELHETVMVEFAIVPAHSYKVGADALHGSGPLGREHHA